MLDTHTHDPANGREEGGMGCWHQMGRFIHQHTDIRARKLRPAVLGRMHV